MAAQTSDDPYRQLPSKYRKLPAIADAVLGRIAEYGELKSAQDFLTELQHLNSDEASRSKKSAGLYAALEHHFRPATLDDLAVRRLALVCRAAEVVLGYTPWHHQIVCALVLNLGVIVEMPNGSGKTLAAALAAAFNSTLGNRSHIVTSNDYLAERDVLWMGPLYQLLGLSVGVVFSNQSLHFRLGILGPDGHRLTVAPKVNASADAVSQTLGAAVADEVDAEDIEPLHARNRPRELTPDTTSSAQLRHETTADYTIDRHLELKNVFACDIVYGRIEEFGFAYLRDNLEYHAHAQVITQRHMLIVDECDAILLDDLRTPLIHAQSVTQAEANLSPSTLRQLHELALHLIPGEDLIVDGRGIQLTYRGLERIKQLTGTDFFTDEACGLAFGLVKVLEALHVYRRDVDYLVQAGQIVIIDQDSGRLLPGRRYLYGLQQALEIKEGLRVNTLQGQSRPVAVITIKHFVRTYRSVSGMSGIVGAPKDYWFFYGLDTVSIQPYAPTRTDYHDLVYRTKHEAYHGVADEAIAATQRGQPVLVNVPNIQAIDALARIFKEREVLFQALDPRSIRNQAQEAEAIARAGQAGTLTICPKIAARGTDIVISSEARAAGGLFVIGLERGWDRRYDDQLRGRAARHGDPGASLFVLSLEDDLLLTFDADWLSSLLGKLGMRADEPIEHRLVTRSIARAQRKVQRHDHQIRMEVVERDDVLERHRSVFYDIRQKVLTSDDLQADILTMIGNWAVFKSQTLLRSKLSGTAAGAEDYLVFGRLGAYFDPVETQRTLQVRSRKLQHDLLEDTLRRKVLATLKHGPPSGALLKDQVLAVLDAHWTHYLQFEGSMRDEMNLYRMDFPKAVARYTAQMEGRFDRFFYDAGEDVLAGILEFRASVQLAPEWPEEEANHG